MYAVLIHLVVCLFLSRNIDAETSREARILLTDHTSHNSRPGIRSPRAYGCISRPTSNNEGSTRNFKGLQSQIAMKNGMYVY